MRTIALEEHFLANGFRAWLDRTRPTSADRSSEGIIAQRQAKLQDLATLRLQDMAASGIDLQVISHTAEGIVSLSGDEGVRLVVDYPYSTNEQGRTFLDQAPISRLEKEKISHLNAERLLKLTHS
jgi:predicted TIM-barrel fold metal-dependent hydrolase